ncbi:MAG: extracellular solute-binding protein [Clostridiales bacterium]|nr:extracellular solute-binding protein [Clostridiales bacterium]
MHDDPIRYPKGLEKHGFGLYFRFVLAFAVVICSFAVTPACSPDQSMFPTVPDVSATVSDSTQSTNINESSAENVPDIIRIAAPLSEDTVLYLSQLYTAKKSNLLGVGITGNTVSLDYLSTIEPEFTVELFTTSSTGANMSSYNDWKQSDNLPDIVLTDSMSRLIENDYLLPLDDLLAGNDLFLPSNVYHEMVSQGAVEDKQYGIPFSASVSVVFCNREILDRADVSLAYDTDMGKMLEATRLIRSLNENNDEKSTHVIPLYSTSEMLPYLPACFDPNMGYMAEKSGNIDISSQGFRDSVRFLREFKRYDSVERLSDEEKAEIFGTMDPIIAKRVAMWAGRSDEVERWANYMPYTLGIIQIPSKDTDNYSPPALTVFHLCISSQTENPTEATEFATFVALDVDAIMLRNRLENGEGFIPVVQSSEVWELFFLDSVYCGALYSVRENMRSAYYTPFVSNHTFHEHAEQFMERYASALVDKEEDYDELMALINEEYS